MCSSLDARLGEHRFSGTIHGIAACWLMVGVALLLGTPVAMAQNVQDCTISGTVHLPTGDAVAGATARLTGTGIVAGERVVESGYAGRFVFLSVPPGTYSVRVSMEGFATFVQENVVLAASDRVDIKAPLEIAAIEGSVVVNSELPVVDTQYSTIDTVFDEKLIDTVPTNRDVFYDLQLSAAGMAAIGAEESWLPSVSAYGGSQSDNIFLVNGVNTTDPRGAAWGSLVQVNYNNVQEVKVLSLGSKAEYGSFSGAAVDVITKSGSNEFHGDLSYFTAVGEGDRNQPCANCLGADWLYIDPDDDLVMQPNEHWEANVTLGGPIVRDRLWFHASFARYFSENRSSIRATPDTNDTDLFDLKLTTELGRSHRAWLDYHRQEVVLSNLTWGEYWDENMVYDAAMPNDTWSAQYQWVVSDRNMFGFRYLSFETNDLPTIHEEYGRPGYINWGKWTGGPTLGVEGDFPYVEAMKSKRQTLQADFTHFAEDFLGSHDLKFGVQYTRAESNQQSGYFHGYANHTQPLPYSQSPDWSWWWNCSYDWCWGTPEDPVFPMRNTMTFKNPSLTVRHSDSTGAFVDDTWVLSDRITLNLGLRYDRMTARYGKGAVYEMPETPFDINHPTQLRTREGSPDLFNFNTWSPRLGFVWTLTGDGKTALRSNIGRYYAPMGLDSLGAWGPDAEPYLEETWIHLFSMSEVDLNGNGVIDFDEVGPATRLLAGRRPDISWGSNVIDPSNFVLEFAPGTTSPYTDKFHIGVERQLGRDASLELAFVYKSTHDLLVLRPYNTETGEYWEWERVSFTAWTGMETTVWQVALKDYNGDGAVDFGDAEFVMHHVGLRTSNADDYANMVGESADRTYHGLQLTFSKRYSNRWQMLASLNWSDSDGFAPRVASQSWYVDGPVVMERPVGTSPNHFVNNTEGPLPMTPEWLFKVAGSYTIPVIEADLGLRLRYNSGRALVRIHELWTVGTWMTSFDDCLECLLISPWAPGIVAQDPNDPDWLPATTLIDLNLSKNFSLGKIGSLWASFDVFNATNEDSANSVGTGRWDYGRVYGVVLPRRYRLGFKLSF